MRRTFAAAALLFGLSSGLANAQSAPLFVTLGPADAALYKPDSGPAPHVGIVVIHRTADYMRHPACTQLSQRGFMMLCFEDIALDVKAAVAFLRKQPEITKVLLFGHSGGGPTVSFYQAVAENGISYCTNAKRLVSIRTC
jgi:hypothetical protein